MFLPHAHSEKYNHPALILAGFLTIMSTLFFSDMLLTQANLLIIVFSFVFWASSVFVLLAHTFQRGLIATIIGCVLVALVSVPLNMWSCFFVAVGLLILSALELRRDMRSLS